MSCVNPSLVPNRTIVTDPSSVSRLTVAREIGLYLLATPLSQCQIRDKSGVKSLGILPFDEGKSFLRIVCNAKIFTGPSYRCRWL